jgi:hypothetical protein
MLTVATLFWSANDKSKSFSTCYSEAWVEKLYRGFARNLTTPFRFVLYTDRERSYSEPIEQVIQPDLGSNGYADCIRPYEMGVPMILVGLDTVITGNIDHLAKSCMERKDIGLPRDPYAPHRACNGVALVPAGMAHIASKHRGENDMEWLRTKPHSFLDDEFPGEIVSYKGSVETKGLGNAKIVYMHGEKKAHQLAHVPFVKEHWI